MAKKRIVVKIGSSSLTNEQGEIDQGKLDDHVHAIAALRQANYEVILVSSGAIAAGFGGLGYSSKPVTVKGKQAAAAVGQSMLIRTYMEKFSNFDLIASQILLTRADFSDQDRYKNAFATITELLERGVLPIINENDTVSVEELTFGDNDMLSALVSGLLHADELIILTDINGIYNGNPKTDAEAKKIEHLEMVTDEMIEATGSTGSKVGTGGMKSKLMAARTALSLGVSVFIGKGEGDKKLLHISRGVGDGTYISNTSKEALNTKRQWIAIHSECAGEIYIDDGAADAILYHGKSLLPAGVVHFSGNFNRQDVVKVYSSQGLLGKGEVNCSSLELDKVIKSRKKPSAEPVFTFVEVIHRDKWVTAGKLKEGIQ